MILTNRNRRENRTEHIFAGDTIGNVFAWNENQGRASKQIVKGSGSPAVLSSALSSEHTLEGVTMVVRSNGQFQLWHLLQKGEKKEQRKIRDLGFGSKGIPSYTPDGSSVLVPFKDQM